jgi:2,4-dienoyl-CoA reductase-like NADH-dependent reductase (Old Yellow Enzyme family)/thioredoxin reductase
MRLRKICEAAQIGKLDIRNRMVMPAMLGTADPEGFVTEGTISHFEERAKGGTGLIIVGACSVDHRRAKLLDNQLSIDDDKFIPGLSELVRAIHKYGAKAAVQIQHGGNVVKSEMTHFQPVAPSAVARPGCELPRELTVKEIGEIVDLHAQSAERAKKAGFDAVEISACHRYLVQNFLSSAWNKRRDEYGGALKNRVRFLLEIIGAIKGATGQNFPLLVRINGKEYGVEEGTTLEEAKEVAVMIQEAGVDCVDVTAFPATYPYPMHGVPPTLPLFRHGCYVDLAEAIKRVVRIPVIAAGRITPELGERLLKEGKTDIIAIGRGLIADSELPNKVISGRLNEIRRCLGCQECYYPPEPGTRCTVNAAAFGKEREYVIKPAERTKRILVAGGGPAGMEAARVAAMRGHEVILYERERRLGGQLLLAAMLRDEYETLSRYLTRQLKKLGVKIELEKQVTPETIKDMRADAVILALGPESKVPGIPGIDRENVISAATLKKHRLIWFLGSILMRSPLGRSLIKGFLKFDIVFGQRTVVIGGGLAGSEMADFLVQRGKKVTVVTEHEDMTDGLEIMTVLREYFIEKLAAEGVTMLTGVKYEKATEKGLVITTKEGETRTIEADTIVLTGGAKPNTQLFKAFEGKAPEVYMVGDSNEPRGILEAIKDGFKTGREV